MPVVALDWEGWSVGRLEHCKREWSCVAVVWTVWSRCRLEWMVIGFVGQWTGLVLNSYEFKVKRVLSKEYVLKK